MLASMQEYKKSQFLADSLINQGVVLKLTRSDLVAIFEKMYKQFDRVDVLDKAIKSLLYANLKLDAKVIGVSEHMSLKNSILEPIINMDLD